MKFFHLSDLHLGKRVNEFSMLDDQMDILTKIVALAEEHKPDAVLIAGDVYDKATPIVEAVQLLDRFLVWLNELGIVVFMISGNHDSAERVAFGAELLKNSNVHIVKSYQGKLDPVTITDDNGELYIWMLPYLKPSLVKRHFPDKAINTYTEALRTVLSGINLDSSKRNILVAHQFVTGATTSESEEIYIGGSENVDGSLFDTFDYVALGHLHRPQYIGRETLRYSGSPLKYSFSEANDKKSVTVVEMGDKGDISISTLPLTPAHEMQVIKGTYSELMSRDFQRTLDTDNYVRVVLTDEYEEPDARRKMEIVYKNLMSLEYDNKRTQATTEFTTVDATERKTPTEYFADFFQMQNGQPPTGEQSQYVAQVFAQIFEEANA
ncbi:MAG: exonuclease SbcCD subunit D [Bifidobacteriaceae bacterium]|jgi:exonuclease SbcD|nr:exonuclease SbcCD subunit D [Bifidobacteriaceae bacterium]